MTSDRKIRVYCPQHGVAFEASAGAPIHCKDKQEEHLLAERFPPDDFWEYCCDCDRFYPFQSANDDRRNRNLDVEQCVSCKRQAIRRYLCDYCKVVSVESKEKGDKSYRITATGLVRLAKGPIRHECPACLKSPQAVIGEHHCRKLESTFTTARDECPFCGTEIQTHFSEPGEQTRVNPQSFSRQPAGEQTQPVSVPSAENDSEIVSPIGGESSVTAVQPPPSGVHRAQQFGNRVVTLARKHAVATATIISLVLAIVGFLLTPTIRARFNHPPRVSNIVVNPPVIAPGKNVSLIGMASDPDGDLLTYQWSCSSGAVILWNNQYAQLKLDEPGVSAQGAKIAVHLEVMDPYGAPGILDADITVQPPQPNRAPTLNLVADKQVVAAGEKVILKAEASDKDDEKLSFKWSCSNYADAVSGEGSQVTLDTAKVNVGSGPVLLTVSSIVNDDHGNSTSDKIPILVVSRQFNKMTVAKMATRSVNRPFTLSLSAAEKSWVYPGERLKLVGTAFAPHTGDALTYQWDASNGCVIEGVGSNVWLNTSTLNPKVDMVVVQVNLTVRDQHGSIIRGSIRIFVLPKPTSSLPPPAASPSGIASN
jgi:hypothetical protein